MSIIAVDFDGTLCEEKWPEIGEANIALIRELILRQTGGDKIILWTCRRGELLDNAVAWCKEHGLCFDAVNENLPEHIAQYGDDTRKVFADEYWDDKAVIVGMKPCPFVLKNNENGFDIQTWEEVAIERVTKPPIHRRIGERLKKWLCG